MLAAAEATFAECTSIALTSEQRLFPLADLTACKKLFNNNNIF